MLCAFFWESLESRTELVIANISMISINTVLIIYEAHKSRLRCLTWILIWFMFTAFQRDAFDRKNPLTLSAVAFAFRLVMQGPKKAVK